MSQDHEEVKFKKYSTFTVLKIIIGCWVIAGIMNIGSYSLVGFNNFMSKVIGISETVYQTVGEAIPEEWGN